MKRLVSSFAAALVPVFSVGVTAFAAIAVSGNLAANEETAVGDASVVVADDEAATDAEASLAIPTPADAEAAPEPTEAAEAETVTDVSETVAYKETLQVEQDADGNVIGITNFDGDTNNRVPGANVVFSRNGEVVASVVSDANGEFVVPGLQLGAYDVGASAQYGGYTYFVEVLAYTPESAEKDEDGENEVIPVSFEPEAATAEPAAPVAPSVLQLAVPGPDSASPVIPGTIVEPLPEGTPVGGFLPPGAGGGYYGGGGGGFIGGGGGGGVPAGGLGGLGTLLGAGVGVGTAALLDDDDDSQNSPSSP